MGAGHAYGPLSETVEDRLVRRLVAGDRGARRRLIESYMGLVAAIARRYARWEVRLDGLSGSLAAVGEALGVSRERARQLESAALCELRDRRRELGLEGLAA